MRDIRVKITRRTRRPKQNILGIGFLVFKKLLPNFLVGTPNIFDNARVIRFHPQFTPLRAGVASILIFTTILGSVGVFDVIFSKRAHATSYDWIQNNWTGGQSSDTASASTHQTGWNKFESKTGITAGTDLSLTLSTSTIVQTFNSTASKDTSNTTADWRTTGTPGLYTPSVTESITDVINATWGIDRNINSLAYSSTTGKVYIALDSGEMGAYHIATDTGESLTSSVSSVTGSSDINVLHTTPTRLYFGTNGGKLAYIRLSDGQFFSLTSKVSSIFGSSGIHSLDYDSNNGILYIGGTGGKLGKYTEGTDSAAPISTSVGTKAIYALKLSAHKLYVAAEDSTFAIYNTLTDTNTNLVVNGWSGNRSPRGMVTHPITGKIYVAGSRYMSVIDPNDDSSVNLEAKVQGIWTATSHVIYSILLSGNDIYLAGSLGKIARFTPNTNDEASASAATLVTAASGYMSTTRIASITSVGNNIYLGADNGKFGVYNASSTQFVKKSEKLAAVSSSFMHNENAILVGDEIYFGGEDARFAAYNHRTGTSTDYSTSMISAIGTSEINRLLYDPLLNRIYVTGNGAKFAYFELSTKSTFLISHGISSSLTLNSLAQSGSKIFVGGNSSAFAYFDSSTGTATTIVLTGLSSNIQELNASNGIIFIGGTDKLGMYRVSDGKFWVWTSDSVNVLTTYTGTGSSRGFKNMLIDGAYVYAVGSNGLFIRFIIPDMNLQAQPSLTVSNLRDEWGLAGLWSSSATIHRIIKVDSKFYLSGDARFAVVDNSVSNPQFISLTSKLQSDIKNSNAAIKGLVYESVSKRVYLFGFGAGSYSTEPIGQSININSSGIDIAAASAVVGGSNYTLHISNNGGSSWNQYSGTEIVFPNTGTDFRWKVLLGDGGTVTTITFSVRSYSANGSIISSAFNTENAGSVLTAIIWNQNIPTGTDIIFQLSTALDNNGTPGTFSGFIGPDGTDTSYFTAASGTDFMPIEFSNGSADQWIKYKAYLTTTNRAVTPTLSGVTVQYVINNPPEFDPGIGVDGSTAVQNQDGTVSISYAVKDIDTSGGSFTPGFVTPAFQYSIDGGGTWAPITGATLAVGGISNKSVNESEYSMHSATWKATSTISNVYSETAQVRVVISDNERANSKATSTTVYFTLDTKAPQWDTIPLIIDGSQSPAVVTVQCSDDSDMEMRVGLRSNLSDASWQPFSSTIEINLETDPDNVYAQCRDVYGNTTAIKHVTTPKSPNLFYQDLSIPANEEYKLLLAWNAVPEPDAGFKQYNLYRSVDGSAFDLIYTNSSRTSTQYYDLGLSPESEYTYIINVEDLNGSLSFYSEPITDIPDGEGNALLLPPIVSHVRESKVSATQANIEWETNKLSESKVYFVASETEPESLANYVLNRRVKAMTTQNIVSLNNLTPGTNYYYYVESLDFMGLVATSTPRSFATNNGVLISIVTPIEIYNSEAIIKFRTSAPATGYVAYSQSTDFDEEIVVAGEISAEHSITISNLNPGQKYYYYVKAVDENNNESVDRNIENGEIKYYTLTTTDDSEAPIISSVSASLIAEEGVAISWSTNEPSTSQVEWGLTTSLGTLTTQSSAYTKEHAVIITDLTSNTDYYYRVISADKANNISSDDNNGEMYTYKTRNITTVRSGGGGGQTIDTTPPTIYDIQVSVSNTSAIITWQTDEASDSFVKYGTRTNNYTKTDGDFADNTTHRITLSGLQPSTQYFFVAQGKDKAGNLGRSSEVTFKTTAQAIENPEFQIPEITESPVQGGIVSLFMSLFNDPRVKGISEQDLVSSLASVTDQVIGAPEIFGVTVKTGSKVATIEWATNKPSNSLVAYATSREYLKNTDNLYTIVVGDPDTQATRHVVTLTGLESDTVYNFQARSQGRFGPVGKSLNDTFKTSLFTNEVTGVRFAQLSDSSVTLVWETDFMTKAMVVLVNSVSGEVIRKNENSFNKEHSMIIDGLMPSTGYTVKLIIEDEKGSLMESSILPFVTEISKLPAEITQIRGNSTLIQENSDAVQTIFTWKTNKPTTSRVHYGLRGATELNYSTPQDNALVVDHVAITTAFKPGQVYQYYIESIDGSGNVSKSKTFTLLTPMMKKSIISLIMDNLEATFKFLER